jgi:MFS-type transporter involved in bile tolerance (Atg22 family)
MKKVPSSSDSEKKPPLPKSKVKAVLLSALVFPGLGQLFQKRYLIAAIVISLSSLCMYILFTEMLVETNAAAARIMQSGSMDFMRIHAEARQIVLNLETPLFLGAGYSLIALWLLSIFDIFKPLLKK